MRVLLISANTEQINMPILPLGLSCVAAATRQAGHDVKMIDLMFEEDIRFIIDEAIQHFDPQVIGVSVRNIDNQSMEYPSSLLGPVKKVIDHCRSFTEAPIVLGGAGYSIFPAGVLDYLGAEMGIQGEGEIAFPSLVARLEGNVDVAGLPGLYLPGKGLQGDRQFIRDLDTLPRAGNDLRPPSAPGNQEFWFPVQSRRGCPLECSYCSTAVIEGQRIRKRSPRLVVEEIQENAEKGFDRFFFVDNTFNMPPSYARELCERLTATGVQVTWRCILYPHQVDAPLLKAMVRAGCKEVSLGFESGCDRILRAMNKRFHKNEVRRISAMLADHGISRMGFLLLGGPCETRESVEESLAFADSLDLEGVKVTAGLRIYPGTSLAATAVERGIIASEDDLLPPRFFLERGLEEWLPETLSHWVADRPHWVSG